MKVLTLQEAAKYLRVSRSWLYQRKDVPRHQIPGSRNIRFFEEELAEWLRRGNHQKVKENFEGHEEKGEALAVPPPTRYHRRPRPSR